MIPISAVGVVLQTLFLFLILRSVAPWRLAHLCAAKNPGYRCGSVLGVFKIDYLGASETIPKYKMTLPILGVRTFIN